MLNQFLNPKPQKQSQALTFKKKAEQEVQKHGKQVGSYLDDMGDIYDHTKQLFKNKNQENDDVQINTRRIKNDISDIMNEMDPKVYAAKKMSRQELNNRDMSEEISSEEEDFDEDQEDELEEGEQEFEEISESKKSIYSESDDDILSEKQKNISKQMLALASQKEKENEDQLDQILQKLQKTEKKVDLEDDDSDLKKAQSVRIQKKIYDQFLQQRILLQKPLTYSWNMPQNYEYIQVLLNDKNISKSNEEINNKLNQNKRKLKTYIKNLQNIQKSLYKISKTDVVTQDIISTASDDEQDQEEVFESERFWEQCEQNFQKSLPFYEQTIDRWNSTQQNNLIQKLQKKNEKNLFNKSILEQINQQIEDPVLKQQAIEKTRQIKNDNFQRILGPIIENEKIVNEIDLMTRTSDACIYNDQDLYKNLLTDFLAFNGEREDDEKGQMDDHYLYGADLSLTQKFIIKKQKLKEIGMEKKNEIDRKATKGRKIKYIVHEKLLNFMQPIENLQALEAKDSVLSNMFGQNSHLISKENNTKTSINDDQVKLI